MADQVIVLKLREGLSRTLRDHIESGKSGYESIQEFISVAIENQLHLEHGSRMEPNKEKPDISSLLAVPTERPASLLETVPAIDQPLFVLTNRLAPLKVAVRALANLALSGHWPKLEQFQRSAALVARFLGTRLRQQDAQAGRSGSARRWVAFPVGENAEVSLSRFINSFTLWVDGQRSAGPMAILRLAGVQDGRVLLTLRGWDLASMPSPLTEDAPGNTLSEPEAGLLRDTIVSAPAELQEARSFLNIVLSTGGLQANIDRRILAEHHGWSENMAAAQRSAMIGRLGEVRLLLVEGRGPKARVKLLERAFELMSDRGEDHEDLKDPVGTGDGDNRP